MSQYTKDGKIYDKITSVKLNGKQIINPNEAQILAAGYEVYVEPEKTEEEKLADAIELKLEEVDMYSDLDDMNSYVAQGVTIRLPLDLRLRLRNVIDSKISLGETMLTEWYEGVSYTYPLTAWDTQLAQYENYLYEVMCNAEKHKSKIKTLTTLEKVEDYDYTTGYPEQLNFGTYEDDE